MILSGINLFDILLSAFYSAVILFLALLSRKIIKKSTIRKYFVPYISYKIFTAVAFVLIHIYYYKGGDTFMYFFGSKFFIDIFQAHPERLFTYFFSSYENLNHFVVSNNFQAYNYLSGNDTIFMSRFVAIFSILGFKQYLATSILFTVFCSIGQWLIFLTLNKIYPQLHKYFAIGTLFFPTIALWGSGILKDPLTLAAIGVIFYSTFLLIKGKRILLSIIGISISIYFCLFLKPYILYLFIPIMLYWSQGHIKEVLKGNILRIVITPLIIVISFIGGSLFISEISNDAGKYSLDNMENVAKGFHSWHNYLSETRDQSGYTLGEIKYTPLGLISKAPASVFVTFFRPFPFVDTRNIATWFEAVQSFTLLIITIYVILRVGLIRFFILLISNKDVRTFMLFALAFGFAVGFTSYNYGALSRYKIPCLPFYTAALAIIYYLGYKKKTSSLSN